MVQVQQGRDRKILDLVTTMESTYSFVASMDELKKSHVLQDIVAQILKQTIECDYFIQEYLWHNFEGMWWILLQPSGTLTEYESEKVIMQPFIGTILHW
jgi:hypothetical protein